MLLDCILKFYILDTGTMASRKIYVNVSGSRSAIIASKKTIEASENVEDEVLSFEQLKIKNAREWKNAKGEDKTIFFWYLKEKYPGKPESIHIYCAAFAFLQSDYQILGLLRDICVMPGTEIVYAIVKQPRTYKKIRYCLKVSNYFVEEIFSEFCEGIVNDIQSQRVS